MLYKGVSANVAMGISKNDVKSFKRTIVCIKKEDKIYKIISVNSSKDGSLHVSFPYCSEKIASVFQYKHTYKAGKQKIDRSLVTREFKVDSEAKLSIHQSGFVQLSGYNILSGYDHITGKPRGIGIFSAPMTNPVCTGPTFGYLFWGIEHYEVLTHKKPRIQYIILEDSSKEFTAREIIKGKNLNSYLFEFFIFPPQASEYIYEYKDDPYIDHVIPNYLHNPGARFTHRVLDLKNFPGVLCLFPIYIWSQFAEDLKTGFILGSPSGTDNINNKSMTGQNFFLTCPSEEKFINKGSNLESLNYTKQNSIE